MEILLGLVAASLQATGYLVYGFKVLKRDIAPNPASWLMFAYGTTLLLVLEWDRGASFAVLALPFICAVSSAVVAWYCLRKAQRTWWPEHVLERISFVLDVLLTVAYLATWILLGTDMITGAQKDVAEIFILICWNVGVFTAFFPLLRQVYHHPTTEHPTPWVIWTVAYTILAMITLSEQGRVTELLLYPLLLALVCGWIALHVLYFRYHHDFRLL